MCYLYDVFPTLGAWCGVSPPPKSEGMDLTATLRDPRHTARPDLLFAYQNVQQAIETPEWKLIRYPKVDRTQMFHLKNDPCEIHNLADLPEYTARVAELTELLKKRMIAADGNEPERRGNHPKSTKKAKR